ncbi:MAG: K(+)-transporting ATPase subunit C [Planctomycetota bacterium]
MSEEMEPEQDAVQEDESVADEESAPPVPEIDEQDETATEDQEDDTIPEPESRSLGHHLGTALRLLVAGILVCSIVYTLCVNIIGNVLAGDGARGSVVKFEGRPVGSRLIGQRFTSDAFFHPRPSSKGYDGTDSGSQNLGPLNEELTARVAEQVEELQTEGIDPADVPGNWVTESGSSLDPHISPAAARLQIPRVSRETGLSEDTLEKLVDKHSEGKFLGLFGQRRVNVLLLNLDIQEHAGKAE